MIIQKYLTSLSLSYLYGSPIKQLKPIMIFGGDERLNLGDKLYKTLNESGYKTGYFKRKTIFSYDKELLNSYDEVPYNAELQQFLIEIVREKCDYVIFELDNIDLLNYRLVLSEPIISVFLDEPCDEGVCDRLTDFAAESTKSLIFKDHTCKEAINDSIEKHKRTFEFCDTNFYEVLLKEFEIKKENL